jgi:hypothetical protein
MKFKGLNSLLPRITLRLPRIQAVPQRSSALEPPSSSLLPVLASCGLSLYQLLVSSTTPAAKACCLLPRNRAFPALPFASLVAFPVWKSVLPRITLRSAGAV